MRDLLKIVGPKEADSIRPSITDAGYDATVKKIIADVKARGDEALVDLTRKFDWREIGGAADLEVAPKEMELAFRRMGQKEKDALELAAENITSFHIAARPMPVSYEKEDGTRLGQLLVPLDSAGIYVPGGRASYPSTLMMCALAAKAAGVSKVYCCTPPGKDGSVGDAVLAAAYLCGVDRVFKVGGAQAVAAMAYSTRTIPSADIIVGPGNAWVTAAKRAVMGDVRIDMLAGPSELMVIADETADPDFVAADLLAQAEHDYLACTVLVSTSKELCFEVRKRLGIRLAASPRRDIASESLSYYGAAVLVDSVDEALEVANGFAPEHLELCLDGARGLLGKVKSAGTVFLGRYSAEAMGDYVAGPSHVLPTMGTAKSFGTLSAQDFMKRINTVEYSREGFLAEGPAAVSLAKVEGLYAHAESVQARLTSLNEGQDEVFLDRARPVVKLDANECSADVPPGTKALMLAALSKVPFNRYPTEDSTKLRKALSSYYGISEDRFVIGVGSDELILAVMLGLRGFVDEVVAPGPTFSMYRRIARMCGLPYREVGLDEKGFPDEKRLEEALANGRSLVFLCVPNNPTGVNWQDMARRLVPKSRAYVVIDQAYAEFSGLDMNDLATGRIIAMRTFSKARRLAGIRVGYSISSPETAKLILAGKLPYNMPSICEEIAIMALGEESLLRSYVEENRAERGQLAEGLRLMGLDAFEGDCNFVTVNTQKGMASKIGGKLAEEGMLTRTFKDQPDILRITVGTRGENACLLDSMASIKAAVEGPGSGAGKEKDAGEGARAASEDGPEDRGEFD